MLEGRNDDICVRVCNCMDILKRRRVYNQGELAHRLLYLGQGYGLLGSEWLYSYTVLPSQICIAYIHLIIAEREMKIMKSEYLVVVLIQE